jgi:hypothetical protein
MSIRSHEVQDLTGQVTKSPGVYIAYGGFSDIYKGNWTDPNTGQSTVVSNILDGYSRGRRSI